jgi:hypothetical protein
MRHACPASQNLAETINDTEGLVWGLYYHLWKKTHKGLPCPDINIPHTVCVHFKAPLMHQVSAASLAILQLFLIGSQGSACTMHTKPQCSS